MDETRPQVEPRITWQEAVDAWRRLLAAAESHRKTLEADPEALEAPNPPKHRKQKESQ